jgi:hypothetical protein
LAQKAATQARVTETFSNEQRGQEICESEIGRHAKCQRGHAQSSSAEKDDRPNADAWMARRTEWSWFGLNPPTSAHNSQDHDGGSITSAGASRLFRASGPQADQVEHLNKMWCLPHLVIELPVTIDGKGVPTRETHQAKIDHDDSVAGPGQHFGGDCADGWFAKSSRTSIDELGPAISSGCRTGRPPPAARRSSALGEKPDGSERSVNRENAALETAFAVVARY